MKYILTMIFALCALSAYAQEAGDFDYYVLALSWNAGFCAVEGEEKGAEICDPHYDYGFRLHGLWPQYDDGGWPEFCQSATPNPSRSDTAKEADLYGSSGYAWHQWNKHGRCSGLTADEYYQVSRALFDSFVQPEIFKDIDKPMDIPNAVIEEAIIEANPNLTPQSIGLYCRDGVFVEARICLDKSGAPRECTGDMQYDCDYTPEFMPVR